MSDKQHTIRSRVRRRLIMFAADLAGTLSVETVIIFPILTWAFVAMFVFFDAFRSQDTNLKAAYTISDLLSRELNPINQPYVNGLHKVFNYLTISNQPTWIRVTVVKWDDANNVFKVQWSDATNGHAGYTNATIGRIASQIPAMPSSDTAIIVQTAMIYTPAFNVGLAPFVFKNLVVTRPRFAPQLLWAN